MPSQPIKTTGKRPSRKIVSRTMRCEPASCGWWITVRQTLADGTIDQTVYGVDEIGSTIGRSFELTRVEGDELIGYRVSVAGNGQQHCERTNGSRDECPAFRKSRGLTCKHCEMCRKAIEIGAIAGGIPGDGDDF